MTSEVSTVKVSWAPSTRVGAFKITVVLFTRGPVGGGSPKVWPFCSTR